jgi:hypothetical protein
MTENQTANQEPGPTTKATPSEAGSQARQLADQTVGAGQHLMGTAKESVAQVAGEVKGQASSVLSQARTGLTDQLGAQQQKAAEGLHAIAEQLSSMASGSDSGPASTLVQRVADRTTSAAAWLEAGDLASLLNDVASFARRRPGAFLALAAGAGAAVGRLSRGLAAGAPSGSGGTAHRAPGAAATGAASGTPKHARQSTSAPATSALSDPFTHEPTVPPGQPPVSVDALPPGPAGGVPSTDPYSTGRH